MTAKEWSDSNPDYWTRYTNLQRTKHALVRNYLQGWFAMYRSWAGRLVYMDTHAGRGKHRGGQLGSPLLALRTLLRHKFRARILRRCEVVFNFIELDKRNLRYLRKQTNKLGQLPSNVRVETIHGDSFKVLTQWIGDTRENGDDRAPAFVFVDPYGFKMPGSVLRELMGLPRVELFVNVMWRELNMAIHRRRERGVARTLDLLFDGMPWRKRIASSHFDGRAEQALSLFREVTGARWATYIRMPGRNGAIRYHLVHLTNHDAGRDLMKKCIWEACPVGGYYVRRAEGSSRHFAITREPDLVPLREWVLAKLDSRKRRWWDLLEDIRPEIWQECQVNRLIYSMHRRGIIRADRYDGNFGPKANPRLYLSHSRPNEPMR